LLGSLAFTRLDGQRNEISDRGGEVLLSHRPSSSRSHVLVAYNSAHSPHPHREVEHGLDSERCEIRRLEFPSPAVGTRVVGSDRAILFEGAEVQRIVGCCQLLPLRVAAGVPLVKVETLN